MNSPQDFKKHGKANELKPLIIKNILIILLLVAAPQLFAQETSTTIPQLVPPLTQSTTLNLPNPMKTTGLSEPLLGKKETVIVVIKPDPTIEIQKSIEVLKPPPKPKKKE